MSIKPKYFTALLIAAAATASIAVAPIAAADPADTPGATSGGDNFTTGSPNSGGDPGVPVGTQFSPPCSPCAF